MQKLLNLPDWIFKYLAAAILIIVPLYPKFPFITIPGIYVAVRLEDFLIAILGVVTVIKLIPKMRSVFRDSVARSVIIFFTAGIVSLISAVILTKTASVSIGTLHFLRRVEYMVPLFAVFAFFSKKTTKDLEFYIKILIIVVLVAFIYGLGERYFHFPVIITQNDEYSKGIALLWTPGTQLNSTFAGHYDLATFLVFVLPVLITLLFVYKNIWAKIILAATTASGLWLLSGTASRTAIVSYIFASCISLLLVRKYKAIPVILIVSLLFFGASTNVLSRYSQIIEVTYKKIINIKPTSFLPKIDVYAQESVSIPEKKGMQTPTPKPVFVFEDRSTSIRLNVEWPRAIRALSKNPLLGTGYSSLGLATDNDYLRSLGETGVLGFLSFALIFFYAGNMFFRAVFNMNAFSATEKGYVAGIIGGTLGILTNAFFIDVFEASKDALIFWLLFAFAIYTVKYTLEDKNG